MLHSRTQLLPVLRAPPALRKRNRSRSAAAVRVLSEIDRVFVESIGLEKRQPLWSFRPVPDSSQHRDRKGQRREERAHTDPSAVVQTQTNLRSPSQHKSSGARASTQNHQKRDDQPGSASLVPISSQGGGGGGDTRHGVTSLSLTKAQRTEDPSVLWAIIHSLLDSEGKSKQTFEQMPRLSELTCIVCNAPTSKFCAGCRVLGYCSVEHQVKDWPKHAERCHAWTAQLSVLTTGSPSPKEAPAASENSAITQSSRSSKEAAADVNQANHAAKNKNSKRSAPTVPVIGKAKAHYTCETTESDELPFRRGDILDIVRASGTWWWTQTAGGELRRVPSNFLKMI